MYIGGYNRAVVHHLVYEVVDNSIDEALAGYAKHIEVNLRRRQLRWSPMTAGAFRSAFTDGSIPTVEVVSPRSARAGKFEHNGRIGLQNLRRPARRGGERGQFRQRMDGDRGLPEGKLYQMAFERGIKSKSLTVIGEAAKVGHQGFVQARFDALPDTNFNHEHAGTRLRELAFLNAGVEIALRRRADVEARNF